MVSHVGDYFAMQGGIIDEAQEREARQPGRSWWAIDDYCHIIPEALGIVREDVGYRPINVAAVRLKAAFCTNLHTSLEHTTDALSALCRGILGYTGAVWIRERLRRAQGDQDTPSRERYDACREPLCPLLHPQRLV